MATLRNEQKKCSPVQREFEEHPWSNLAQNASVPRSQGDCITQLSDEIEGRVTKKLSQEFTWTESIILGALSCLDNFLLNPLIQGYSGTAPKTSRNAYRINQGTNDDNSQSDPHPEAGIFHNETRRNSGPEDGHDTYLLLCKFERLNESWS